MIVGITGKSGVGKTAISNLFFKNYHIINIDDVGHKVMEYDYIKEKIKNAFNIDLNTTSRVALGDLVFNDRHKMKQLNDIIWQEMQKIINKEIAEYDYIVLDWILLPHSHYFNKCNVKILVTADEENRINRVLKRDNITLDYLKDRDSNSIEYNKNDFNFIIENNLELEV